VGARQTPSHGHCVQEPHHSVVGEAGNWVAKTVTLRHIAVVVAGTGIATLGFGAVLGTIGFIGFDVAAAGIFIAGGIIAGLSVPLIIIAFWPPQRAC
jgi:hypothetical protein